MGLKRMLCSAAAGFLAAALLCPPARAASSAAVISAALGEVGYREGAREYTRYGDWYGLPNSYWCDMFISWCAMKGNVPASRFPRNCSCTAHVRSFASMGRYQASAARGGSYIPQQGDAIFFYNYLRYPSGAVKNHTGLVLYAENGYVYTIEGNALANRLDISFADIVEFEDGDLEPLDYVTVNRYPLDYARIHGYGVPNYDDRTPLQLDGFVDLGIYADRAAMFRTLCEEGVMEPTSEHTFSPAHGMTRGEFLIRTANFFGLRGHVSGTAAFHDVQPDNPCYGAVMAARSAGIISGGETNRFLPDQYVSAESAREILNRALTYVGLPQQEFTFTEGDYTYMVSPYTIRADIAQAFFSLCQKLPLPEAFEGGVFLADTPLDWTVKRLNGVCYVPLESLQTLLPAQDQPEQPPDESGLETVLESTSESAWESAAESGSETAQESAAESGPETAPESAAETAGGSLRESGASAEQGNTAAPLKTVLSPAEAPAKYPVPMAYSERVIPAPVTLQNGGASLMVDGFLYQGVPYVAVRAAADFLSIGVEWNSEKPGTLTLTRPEPAASDGLPESAAETP